MRRVALKIAYLGTEYYGFQRQPDLPTVGGRNPIRPERGWCGG